MTSSFEQISNAPFLYVNNLNMFYLSSTTISVYPGQCRDSTNTFDIIQPNTTTVHTSYLGINGLDKGIVAANKLYYLYIIFDITNNNPPAYLFSLSIVQPFMPAGYGAFRRIGAIATDGSANIMPFNVSGFNSEKVIRYDPLILIVASGHSTVNTPINLLAIVPAIDDINVQLQVGIIANAANDVLSLFISDSSAVSTQVIFGQVSGVSNTGHWAMPAALISGVPTVTYKLSNALSTANIHLVGYTDSL